MATVEIARCICWQLPRINYIEISEISPSSYCDGYAVLIAISRIKVIQTHPKIMQLWYFSKSNVLISSFA